MRQMPPGQICLICHFERNEVESRNLIKDFSTSALRASGRNDKRHNETVALSNRLISE